MLIISPSNMLNTIIKYADSPFHHNMLDTIIKYAVYIYRRIKTPLIYRRNKILAIEKHTG